MRVSLFANRPLVKFVWPERPFEACTKRTGRNKIEWTFTTRLTSHLSELMPGSKKVSWRATSRKSSWQKRYHTWGAGFLLNQSSHTQSICCRPRSGLQLRVCSGYQTCALAWRLSLHTLECRSSKRCWTCCMNTRIKCMQLVWRSLWSGSLVGTYLLS